MKENGRSSVRKNGHNFAFTTKYDQQQSQQQSQQQQQKYTTNPFFGLILFVTILLLLLYRMILGYYSYYSGANNYHGLHSAYGGDYECQRHWMEVTYQVPLSLWYYYDLYYWGLDYPPLSAYLSYLFGYISYHYIDPASMILNTSRGFETLQHKLFMRNTVLITDLLLYFTSVGSFLFIGIILPRTTKSLSTSRIKAQTAGIIVPYIFALIQPGLILIDHGHFQYNTTSLGFALWSFYYITHISLPMETSSKITTNEATTKAVPVAVETTKSTAKTTTDATTANTTSKQPGHLNINDHGSVGFPFQVLWGAMLFCCALSFKQMTLYYAPTVFFYLLGRCCEKHQQYQNLLNDENNGNNASTTTRVNQKQENKQSTTKTWEMFGYRFVSLGVVVIFCFGCFFGPFILYGPIVVPSYYQRILHIIRRIIPIQRGLFEGKVANLWYVLSVQPIRLRQRIPSQSIQSIMALITTFVMMSPACYYLFHLGKRTPTRFTATNQHHLESNKPKSPIASTTRTTSQKDVSSPSIQESATNRRMNKNRNPDLITTASSVDEKEQLQQKLFLEQSYIREQLLWGMASCSLAFFLASYQVHEKSILLSLTPISLLYQMDVTFCFWYGIVTTWTLYPLIQLDRLQVPYYCTILIYFAYHQILHHTNHHHQSHSTPRGFFEQNKYIQYVPKCTYGIMIGLHLLETIYQPPQHLPDLFIVLRCISGCFLCCLAWFITCWHLHRLHNRRPLFQYTDDDNLTSTRHNNVQKENVDKKSM